MGYGELARHLVENAERRKAELLASARDEAGRRVAAAMAQAGEFEREMREAFDRETAREREARMSRARLDANASCLRARAAIVNGILERLRERLSRLPAEKDYPEAALRLYREILPEIPPGGVTVKADPAALAAIGPLIADPRIRLAPLPEEELGGVEISDESGDIIIRNTLKARLDNARPALLAEIHRCLGAADE